MTEGVYIFKGPVDGGNVTVARESLAALLNSLPKPVLIVSTIVGKGNVSIAEALKEMFTDQSTVHHVPIEELLPANAVNEDLLRYRFISNNIPFLLNLIYKIPIFYYRKFVREKVFGTTDLSKIKEKLNSTKAQTVIGISHRATFWFSVLKKREKLKFGLWGVLSEFGYTLAWKYVFWEVINGYISPIDKKELGYNFPKDLIYVKSDPVCRKRFYEIAAERGDTDKVLFIAGFWGQIFYKKALTLLSGLLNEFPRIKIIMICGTNEKLFDEARAKFRNDPRVKIHGVVNSTAEIMRECASVITKPGFSTIIEAHAAERAIFLMKGMPVAEDNNAGYAIAHFAAAWFTIEHFKTWYDENAVPRLPGI